MRISLAFVLLAAACAQQKTAVSDDFNDFSGLDEKSDAFSYRMKIMGSLDYGQTSTSVKYTKTPRYRAFKFGATAGDDLDVWVRSTDGGDSVAWVLDNGFHVLGTNDDADATTFDSHISLTVPANASITHYVVFRDYSLTTSHFKVELSGGAVWNGTCSHDSDCVAVYEGGCCPNGRKVAVSTGTEDEYAAAHTCTIDPHPACPLNVILDRRMPECNFETKHCEMVAPEDIKCGGHTTNPHACPANFTCEGPQLAWDAPGSCVDSP